MSEATIDKSEYKITEERIEGKMKFSLKEYFKSKTFKLRHKIAKILVPSLYKDWLMTAGSGDIRPMIEFCKSYFDEGKDLVGVEIGVFEGSNSRNILQMLPIKKLYLVDPYIDTAHCMFTMEERLKPFKEKVQLIRKYSKDAVGDVRELLDFVYIDGNHNFLFVKDDIDQYFSITKKGGVVGGHDYIIGEEGNGVSRAVDEFVIKNNLKLYQEKTDWWVVRK